MARIIWTLNKSLTDAQIAAIYALAEKLKVGISLYGNTTPSPARDSFTWQVSGSSLRVVQFTRHVKSMLRWLGWLTTTRQQAGPDLRG